ncbi:DNA polymerase III subunit delta [Paralimibaculum aggregatum]|uniref:DNA-directed DNA polymerase n=1 Tax=Paralimibaculum aggregatum TaxID=3036245 RepID=A0ABQ6LTF1_9RHOB|nr:DNA polymerase III subunit delta [Limibaculum sp. NKW23]GMG85373.1 DNA polymerase III subunit delta [Limibaculum sp. NKW23]
MAKLAGSRGAAFCRKPDLSRAGVLLHGPDAALLGLRRRDLVAAVTEGDPMRLTRLEPEAVRRDPAALDTALKARGFFAGRQAVAIEGAKDALTQILAPLLGTLTPDDAFLVVTATGLGPRSSLRRLFEAEGALLAIGLYPDPPDAAEITGRLAAAGGPRRLSQEASGRLETLAAELDPGSFERFLEALALYAQGAEELSAEDVAALSPQGAGAEVDLLVGAVAEAQAVRIGPLLARLAAGGTAPGSALGAVSRHFRRLYTLAVAPRGPMAAVEALRPPVRGPRRDALLAQLRIWPAPRLETAQRTLAEAERRLRSPGEHPEAALVERILLRVALMAARN